MNRIKMQSNIHDLSSADEPVLDADFKCGYVLKQDLILQLPPEIISLILRRLSVKTLLILKCVSRFLSKFISSPEFIRAQLKFSSEDAFLFSHMILIYSSEKGSQLRQRSVWSLWRQWRHPSVNFVNRDYPKRELQKSVRLVGSCNGLVFIIVNRRHWFLWNPTIGVHKKLPNIVRHKNLSHLDVDKKKCLRFHYGFGFDEFNDDYKAVALFAYKIPNSSSGIVVCYVVNVYSLKRRSWMRIPDFTGEQFDVPFGMFASGKLHWKTCHGDIVSFDVEKEVFGTLEQPKYDEGFFHAPLSVLQGSISVCCDYEFHVDVWVMKEYGIKESWTKMFALHDYSDFGFTQVHFILPNGGLLMDDGTFIFYNPESKTYRFTGIRSYFHYHYPVIYVESLVSPC